MSDGPRPPPAARMAAMTASVSGAGGVDWPAGVGSQVVPFAPGCREPPQQRFRLAPVAVVRRWPR